METISTRSLILETMVSCLRKSKGEKVVWNMPTKEVLSKIPGLYETEHLPLSEKIIHLHFFFAGSDWYIAEYDGKDLFWGYCILGNDFMSAEWGYISFEELREIKIKGFEIESEADWQPRKASEIEKIKVGGGIL